MNSHERGFSIAMTRQAKSVLRRLSAQSMTPLVRAAVRRAMRSRRSAIWASTALLATGMTGALADARAAGSFPPLFELRTLHPAQGGDGSEGVVLRGIDANDGSGERVSRAGDVNGDGIADLVIGAPGADPDGRDSAGEGYLVFGRTNSPAAFDLRALFPPAGGDGSRGVVLKGIDVFDFSNQSVTGVGDVNGDGVDDLIIDAARASWNGHLGVGACYVVFGRTSGFAATIELRSLLPFAGGDGSVGFVLKGIDDSDSACKSASGAGDVNGDGIDDLLIGAYSAGGGGGQAYVVFGTRMGFPALFPLRTLPEGDGSAGFVLQHIDSEDVIGRSVSAAGDLNGDGIDDVLVGSSNAEYDAGESYVVFGRSTSFPPVIPLRNLLPPQGDGTEGFILRGIAQFDFAGFSVSGAGDVNADGIDDLVIGAMGADRNGLEVVGETYVVFGRATGFPPLFELSGLRLDQGGDGSEGFILNGIKEGDWSGVSVSRAGDVNDDGIDDLVIGAYGADPGGRNGAGESYVVFGRTTGFPAAFALSSLMPPAGGDGSEGFILRGALATNGSGGSVSGAGDVNGDGIEDLLVGAPGFSVNGQFGAGVTYVVFGRGGGMR
jgi:hypothetical protein